MVQKVNHNTLAFTNRIIGNTAFMLLNKPIGTSTKEEQAISGSDFADEAYQLKAEGKDVKVKINSFGGNVFQGWDMVDSIIETKAKTEVVGVAYSMAGVCLMVGSYRTAYPHAKCMIHAPHRSDGKKESTPFMDGIINQFKELLKSHTKFSDEEISEMVTSGKDHYFDAEQMKAKGIIDEIVPTGYAANIVGMSDKEAYLYCNTLIEEELNPNTEMEIFNKLFGGKTDSENAIAAVQMKAENDSLKAEKTAITNEVASLKAKVAELENAGKVSDAKTKATELIEGAEKANKFVNLKAEDKAKLIENATANYDASKIMIDNMASKKSVAAVAKIDTEAKSKEMTYEYLAKNKPEELNDIAENDPELFAKLQDEYLSSNNEKK